MSCLGNIIWFIFGGFFGALGWLFVGILWCISIIGIPVGLQCFKMAKLQLAPFGKDVVTVSDSGGNLILNILWLIFGGLELCIANLISALFMYYYYRYTFCNAISKDGQVIINAIWKRS